MLLRASDLHTYYQPWECGLRVFLRAHAVDEGLPNPYLEVVRRLGLRHEERHLAGLGAHLDLTGLTAIDREQATVAAVGRGEGVIYHPRLRSSVLLDGVEHDIVGEPDYLISQDGGYLIRDSKFARRINEKDHPEICRELELFGWLYGKTFGAAPVGLEVHAGDGQIVAIPYDGGVKALEALREMIGWASLEAEPYHPVSWSGCGDCVFGERCWSAAKEREDPSILVGVDKGLAGALRDMGVRSWRELAANYDERTLAEIRRSYGSRLQKVGKVAERILRSAQALARGEEIWTAYPALPEGPDWVMFDLEGFPPQLHDDEKVFVWGLEVFGANPRPYFAAVPEPGADGDRVAWEQFLGAAEDILDVYGDIAFVHWAPYERVRLDAYVTRFGDPREIAARVRQNLFDMYPVVRDSVALPLPSYSLKVIEQHVGYERKLKDAGGDWAMATYFEATETEDRAKAAELVEQVLAYNREDLEATFAVFDWLRLRCASRRAALA